MEKEGVETISIVYMVAGLSSRFGGKIKPFAVVGKNGENLIEVSLNQALKAGFNKIIFIVGNKTEREFKEKFGDSYKGIEIHYALQKYDEDKRDKPWGTVDSLCSAKEVIKEPFVVCNGDDIYGENSFKILYNHLKENEEESTLGFDIEKTVPEKGSVNRGIFEINNGYVEDLKERLDIERSQLKDRGLEGKKCSGNIFALHPKVIDYLSEILEKFKKENLDNRKIECFLPNEISKLISGGKIKMRFYLASNKFLGVTNPEDEERVREELRISPLH